MYNQHQVPKISYELIEIEEVKVLAVFFPYHHVLIAEMKRTRGTYFSKSRKCWIMPNTPENELRLRKLSATRKVSKLIDSKQAEITTQPATKPALKSKKQKKLQLSEKYQRYYNEFKHYLSQLRYSEATIKTYMGYIAIFLNKMEHHDISQLTNTDIEEYNYQNFILTKQSYSAQNQFINAIRLFLKAIVNTKIDIEAIQRPKRSKHLPTVLTKEEVSKILTSTKNLKHRALLMLIYSAGLRIGETLNLTWNDISTSEQLIYIRNGKGKRDRRVPLSPKAHSMLKTYKEAYRPVTYLFEGLNGSKYSSKSAQNILKKAVKSAGITRRITLHTLRHSYATHLLENGINLRYIQTILGHKSANTTMIYTHVSHRKINQVKSPLEDLDI